MVGYHSSWRLAAILPGSEEEEEKPERRTWKLQTLKPKPNGDLATCQTKKSASVTARKVADGHGRESEGRIDARIFSTALSEMYYQMHGTVYIIELRT